MSAYSTLSLLLESTALLLLSLLIRRHNWDLKHKMNIKSTRENMLQWNLMRLLTFHFLNRITETHHCASQHFRITFISMNRRYKAVLLNTTDSTAWCFAKLRALRNTLRNLLRVKMNKTTSITTSRCRGFVPCEPLCATIQELPRMETVISKAISTHIFAIIQQVLIILFESYGNYCKRTNHPSKHLTSLARNYFNAQNCAKGHYWATVLNGNISPISLWHWT